MAVPSVDPRCDFSDLKGTGRVPEVWGSSRAVVNRVLFGIAHAVSSAPYWVEIRGRQPEPEGPGPAELGWIPQERLFLLGDLLETPARGAPANAEFAVISFLREPTAKAIADAMARPSLGGTAGPAAGAGGTPSVIAIANVDRVNQLFPETPQAMRAVIVAFSKAGLVPYFSTVQPTNRRSAADFVFRATAAGMAAWRSGALVCEKAPEPSSWKVGDELPLTRLPSVSRALSGRVDRALD
jgi:hypothetical protein